MNRILTCFSALVLVVTGLLNAQTNHRTCGTMESLERLKINDPSYSKNIEKINREIDMWVSKHGQENNRAVITIPVVVHVVYNGTGENISEAQVQSQIDALNKDYRRTNTDAGNTPSAFSGIAADTQIEFCLAQRDPSGNPTNGITRTSTSVTAFSTDDKVKYTSQGGVNAWSSSKYLNLWVCDLGNSLLGYAQFPGGPIATDGVVIHYKYFGTTGTATAPFNKGRTATHEVGHWLNLYHIWGDSNCGNDQVSDTPTQQSENYNCPSFPSVTCNNGPNGDMFMNYMDYVNDNCMNMFSVGQGNRMMATMNGSRASLKTSDGCTPVNLAADDAGIFDIVSPSGNSCASTIAPVVTIKNFGSANLVSATISYSVDGGTVNTTPWSGNLSSQSTVNFTLPSINVSAGTHTLNVSTSNPNGGTDGTTSNDAASSSFTIVSTGQALPLAEGFEGVFPPTGWTLVNGDNNITWAKTNLAKKSGSNSIFMDSYDYNADGEMDELILPPVDLSTGGSPKLTFELAYRLYTNPATSPNYSDTLEVFVSTDCGATYTSVYKKFGANLTTISPTYSTQEFVPTNQWRSETVDLSAYSSSQNAFVKFRCVNGYENNLYLDDINISASTTGLASLSEGNFMIYPNPSEGLVNIEFNGIVDAEISVYNILGEKVYAANQINGSRKVMIDISEKPSGVYLLKIKQDNKVFSKKIILSY